MNEKSFLKGTKSEIQALRKSLTISEKNNLNITTFSPNSANDCVYGQITGSCRSPRAWQLINKCCPKEKIINGFDCDLMIVNDLQTTTRFSDDYEKYLSYLESFIIIYKYRKYNNKIISYLKGETNKLPNIFYKK